MGEADNAWHVPSGIRTFLTLMFSDLCGSTRLSASLEADDYAALIEQVRDAAGRIVGERGGQVVQFYGDGLLAIFADSGSSERAIAAARALHAAVGALELPSSAATARLLMHSGVHAGLVLLREGDAARGRLEAIGRPTAIAARLAAAARPDEILVSRGTLGPEGRRLPQGSARTVAISDSEDAVVAIPLLGETIAVAGADTWLATRKRPFVGRVGLLAELNTWLSGWVGDRPDSIAISAPAGQGKSFLSEEVARRAGEWGITVIRGIAAPSSPALQPFRQIDAQVRALLAEPDGKGDAAGESGVKVMLGRMRDLGGRRRLLAILDDWQWADSASLETLNGLQASHFPLQLLILSREETHTRLPVQAGRTVALPPFTAEETGELVQALRPELDPLDAARIHERAGGNPLYVEELCQLPVRSLRLPIISRSEEDDVGWLSTLIGDRLRALPADTLDILRTAAVIGQECPLWLLASVTGTTADSLQLAQLGEQDLLIPSLAPGSVRFKHGITWELIYRLVPKEQRTALHAQLAHILETHAGPPELDLNEALARHFLASGDRVKGAFHCERSGDKAAAVGSADRAQLQYGAALDALQMVPDTEIDHAAYAKLITRFGFSCMFDSDQIQLGRLAVAGERAGRWGDFETASDCEQWAAYVSHGLGRQAAAEMHCRQALALTRKPPESSGPVQLRSLLGQVLVSSGRYAEGMPLLAEAISVKSANRTGRNSSSGLAYALTLKAVMLGDTGHFAEAHAAIAEALEVLEGKPNPVAGSVVGWSCAIRGWEGDWEGLLNASDKACELARRSGTVNLHSVCRALGAYGRWKLGGGMEAAEDLRVAIACMQELGKGLAISMIYGLHAEVMADLGKRDEVRAALGMTYVRHRLGEPFGVSQASRAWARMLAAEDPGRAQRFLVRARESAQRRTSTPDLAHCDLAEARMGLRPAAECAALAGQARQAFESMGMVTAAAEAAAFTGG